MVSLFFAFCTHSLQCMPTLLPSIGGFLEQKSDRNAAVCRFVSCSCSSIFWTARAVSTRSTTAEVSLQKLQCLKTVKLVNRPYKNGILVEAIVIKASILVSAICVAPVQHKRLWSRPATEATTLTRVLLSHKTQLKHAERCISPISCLATSGSPLVQLVGLHKQPTSAS